MSDEITTRPSDPETYDQDSPRFTRAMMDCGLRLDQLPPNVQKTLADLRRNSGADNREAVSIHLSKEVADKLRASGDDWEAQVDGALRNWLEHKESLRRAS